MVKSIPLLLCIFLVATAFHYADWLFVAVGVVGITSIAIGNIMDHLENNTHD
ncbi:hypothetical protein ACLEIY_15930 [Acetobacter tropicalis]